MATDALAAELAAIRDREQARDVPRLLAAVEAALALAGKWEYGPVDGTSALTEDRDWVRADCGAGLREAVARALLGEEKDGG